MSTRGLTVLAGAAVAMAVAAVSAQDPRIDAGRAEYQAKCVACHGESGRGEGPRAESLPLMPPDLTTYARRNGGVFPREAAAHTIDGRAFDDCDHTRRVMPAWGARFSEEAMATPATARAPETYVSNRIAGLVQYLTLLQSN